MTKLFWPNQCTATPVSSWLLQGLKSIIETLFLYRYKRQHQSFLVKSKVGLDFPPPPSCQSKFFGPFHWGPPEYSVAASIFVVTPWWSLDTLAGCNHPSDVRAPLQIPKSDFLEIRIHQLYFCVTKTLGCIACIYINTRLGRLGEIIFETT